jgi:hypothetical protein
MNQPISKLLFFTTLLLVLCASNTRAQKSDHLSMNIQIEDSIMFIEATYRSPSIISTDSIYFLLNPGYALDTIESKRLKSYKITQKKGIPLPFFRLELNETADSTEMLVVEFKYTIDLSQQNHMKSDWIELNADKLWYPNLGALNNAFTYEVTITDFPESYHLITHTDAKITFGDNRLTIKKETPWYEVLLLAGKDLKECEYDQNIRLVGSQEIAEATVQSIGKKVKESIDLLNGYFGMSDPISSFKVVLRNTGRSELGFQFNRRDMIVTGTDFNDYGNLSHEIAHYWFSKADFIREPWMNESFANYGMYLVLKEFNPEDYEKVLSRNRELAKNTIPVAGASLFEANSYASYYHKGALHLISLENKIGPELMRQLLTSCVAKKIRTTEGFLEELEKLTNKENRNFFERLLKT